MLQQELKVVFVYELIVLNCPFIHKTHSREVCQWDAFSLSEILSVV